MDGSRAHPSTAATLAVLWLRPARTIEKNLRADHMMCYRFYYRLAAKYEEKWANYGH